MVDGDAGIAIFDPTDRTIDHYGSLIAEGRAFQAGLLANKMLPDLDVREDNPSLGWRGIRCSLNELRREGLQIADPKLGSEERGRVVASRKTPAVLKRRQEATLLEGP